MRSNYYHNRKHSTIAIIAVTAAVVGAIVAVALYFKKKALDISEKLDFDSDLYYDDEDYFDSSEQCDCCKSDSEKCGCGDAHTKNENIKAAGVEQSFEECEPEETISVSEDED